MKKLKMKLKKIHGYKPIFFQRRISYFISQFDDVYDYSFFLNMPSLIYYESEINFKLMKDRIYDKMRNEKVEKQIFQYKELNTRYHEKLYSNLQYPLENNNMFFNNRIIEVTNVKEGDTKDLIEAFKFMKKLYKIIYLEMDKYLHDILAEFKGWTINYYIYETEIELLKTPYLLIEQIDPFLQKVDYWITPLAITQWRIEDWISKMEVTSYYHYSNSDLQRIGVGKTLITIARHHSLYQDMPLSSLEDNRKTMLRILKEGINALYEENYEDINYYEASKDLEQKIILTN